MICKTCNEDKDASSFYVRKDTGNPRLQCKVCWNARVVNWKKKNPDKVRSYVRKSCKSAYDLDPEKYRKKSRERRLKDPEKSRSIVRKSYSKSYKVRWHMERARLNAANASRRRAAPPWLTAIQKAQIQEYYDVAKCLNVQTGIKHHVDHIMPINGQSSSGLHVPWNLQILTESENCSKKNRVV